jgi:hypothetical protein
MSNAIEMEKDLVVCTQIKSGLLLELCRALCTVQIQDADCRKKR